MSILVRNITLIPVDISDLGVTVETSTPYDLTEISSSDISLSAVSGDLNSLINGGSLICINPEDGITDLTIAQSLVYLGNSNTPHYNMPPEASILDCVDIDPTISSLEELDYLSWDVITEKFVRKVPNDGVVKINRVLENVTLNNNGSTLIFFNGNEEFSSSTDFPRNIKNLYPGQTPSTNPSVYFDEVYNSTTQRWLENPVEFQIHTWRVSIDYTRNGTQSNRELILTLTNPDTGFSIQLMNCFS